MKICDYVKLNNFFPLTIYTTVLPVVQLVYPGAGFLMIVGLLVTALTLKLISEPTSNAYSIPQRLIR